MAEKIKPFYTLILLVLVSLTFFGLGRLSAIEERHEPINIINPEPAPGSNQAAAVIEAVAMPSVQKSVQKKTVSPTPTPVVNSAPVVAQKIEPSEEVIGSKSGKKYYFPWCGTVKRIKPENQVHFASIEEARAAGFLPGGNCKGLR